MAREDALAERTYGMHLQKRKVLRQSAGFAAARVEYNCSPPRHRDGLLARAVGAARQRLVAHVGCSDT